MVQISLQFKTIQSMEVSSFTILELFELDYKHPTILFQNDTSNFFNYNLRKLENFVARAFNWRGSNTLI